MLENDALANQFQLRSKRGVLLELSFGERFPDWLRGLVEHFSLKECEADKYFEGISALGHPFCR